MFAPDGEDIRVTTSNGITELPREVVSITVASTTGELHFRANVLSTAGLNTFYIYSGNEFAPVYADSDIYGAENVWTNGYLAVYHFEEDATSTGNIGLYTDSTANSYDGDDENSSDDPSGYLGGGIEFGDAVNDHVSLPAAVLDGVTDITVSGWWNLPPSSGGTDRMILSAANATVPDEFMLWFDTDGSGDDEFIFEHSNGGEAWDFDNNGRLGYW